MSVPLLDLTYQNESLRKEITESINSVLDSQKFILGDEVKKFEEECASYLGVKYCVGVSSGTDALLMALMALDIATDDEVITTPYTFFATAGSIARLGAKPKFVDIDPDSFNINPSDIESQITDKTKAIMPVHLFGQAADMDKISEISKKHNIPVIEDAAQAFGASFKNIKVGAIGHIGCFSFFPSKNLGGFGDAGLLSTDCKETYEKLLSIRNHGQLLNKRYIHSMVGGNFRIDTLQAAVLRVKLPHIDKWINKRRSNANKYFELLKAEIPESAFKNKLIVLPEEKNNHLHTYNQFILRLSFRDKFLEAAKNSNIGVMVYYPHPLHLQPCFESLGYQEGNMPESENASQNTVALPIFPELQESQLKEVVSCIVKTGKEEGAW